MGSATEEECDLGEEMCVRQKCIKMIKSGKVRTANTMVVRRITWPHKLVYTTGGHPAMYEQLSLPLFLSEYLAVLDGLLISIGILM